MKQATEIYPKEEIKVICSYCHPNLEINEKDNPNVTHGCCEFHKKQQIEEAKKLFGLI